jgi:hypothetical protein
MTLLLKQIIKLPIIATRKKWRLRKLVKKTDGIGTLLAVAVRRLHRLKPSATPPTGIGISQTVRVAKLPPSVCVAAGQIGKLTHLDVTRDWASLPDRAAVVRTSLTSVTRISVTTTRITAHVRGAIGAEVPRS